MELAVPALLTLVWDPAEHRLLILVLKAQQDIEDLPGLSVILIADGFKIHPVGALALIILGHAIKINRQRLARLRAVCF